MRTLKSGEPFVHNISEVIQLECCGCGLVHSIDIEILNENEVLMTFTRANKTEPTKEE